MAGAGAGLAAGTFSHPLGAELYTVRTVLPGAPEKTLEAIAKIGYTEVETDRSTMVKHAGLFRKCGLTVTACHVETPLITGNWKPWQARNAAAKTEFAPESTTLEQAIDEAGKLGVKHLVMAYLLPDERGGADVFRRIAGQMNRAGESCRKAGLRFSYHNHAFEFQGDKGKRPFDVMMEHLDPKAVSLELDVFWLSVAGQDPVETIRRFNGRVPLLHLKDKKTGTPVMYTEAVKPETFQEVGSGSLDFTAILKAGAASGVEHYFVEQDRTAGDPVESLRKSYQYTRKLPV